MTTFTWQTQKWHWSCAVHNDKMCEKNFGTANQNVPLVNLIYEDGFSSASEGISSMDTNEFTARTEQIKKQLYRTAYLYLGSENMALDAVDEAIYRGFISLKKLRQPEYFETWITRILINECKKELRRRKREQPLEMLPETAEDRFDALPLKEAINHLSQELKDIIILRYFTGFTLAETARNLGIPQGTVVTRQRRALGLLRLELSEEE